MKSDLSSLIAVFVVGIFVGMFLIHTGKVTITDTDKYPEIASVPTPTTKVKPVHNIMYQLILSTIECKPDAVNVRINDTDYTMKPNTLSILDWDKGLFEIKTNKDVAIRFYDHELESVWCVQ